MKLFFTCLKCFCWACLLSHNTIYSETALAGDREEPARICAGDLPAAIEEVVNRPELARSRWGIEIQTLSGDSLYSREGDKFFTPASSAKLLVSAAALLELGADYRIATPIYSVGDLPHLTSLRVLGQGDPTITTQSLKSIVHQLQAKGVRKIENLIIDNSYFQPPAINPTWEWLDVHSYFATPVTSTILNQNTVTLTLLPQQVGQPVKFFWSNAIAGNQWQVVNQAVTGKADIEYNIELDGDLGKPLLRLRGELAVNEPPDIWDLAVVDPPRYFLESMRLHLSRVGITVTRGDIVDRSLENESRTKLVTIFSPPLVRILTEINRESNNLYAEALGKILAQELDAENASEAIALSLSKLGINQDEYVLIDASGLSRQNLISPQILVKLLRTIYQTPQGKTYLSTLAVAGTNGTLNSRFSNTAVVGNLWGKTGTLRGVGTLSGYLFPEQHPPLMFSIIVNNSEQKNRAIRQQIDRIIAIANQVSEC